MADIPRLPSDRQGRQTPLDGPIICDEPAAIPNGQYEGRWIGWEVYFKCNGMRYSARTLWGASNERKCMVTALNGTVIVTEIITNG